uniref:Universal stress protein n=1 Tax=Thermodesulfovibrio aggregans TaxID=86166 RepID=A0A7C4EMG5_9BACT
MLVVHHDEDIEEGLSYTLELARIMKKAISILMIYRRKAMERFEDYMVATTFAEEGDFKTAREMIIHDFKVKGIDYEDGLKLIKERCRSQGVEFAGISSSKGNLISGIKNLVEDNSSIDMVLLSPSVTHSAKDLLYRLVKCLSIPIVTMVKNIKGKSA